MTSNFITSIEKIEKSILELSANLKAAWQELQVLKELTAYPNEPKKETTDYFKGMGFRTRDAISEIKSKFGIDVDIDRNDQFVIDTIYKHRVTNFGSVLAFMQDRGYIELKRTNSKNAHILSFKFKLV
jgi:hypothetical protein